MNLTLRLNVTSSPATRRALCLLVLVLSCFGAASSQVQNLMVTPYSVLGSQTSLGTANTANVAVDSKDNIYYPNFYNNAIYKIDTQGNQTVVPTTGLNSPQGMRFDASDTLYLCDAFNSRIVVLTSAGVQTTLPMTGLLQPQHLAFDAGYQNLYVSDRYAGILQYNLASQKTSVYATGLFRPEGIAVDANNNVYYGDGGTLLKNRASFSTVAGEPDALLFDPAGNLYVMSSNGDGLHRVDPAGKILALADDGSNDIAIDSRGVLVMPSHNGQHMFVYLPGPAIWGGRIDAFVGGRIDYHYANTIRTYYSTPAGVTLTSLTIPTPGSPYGGDKAPACSTSTLCGANVSLGAFLPGPQPGYALATFSDGTTTTTPLYGSGLQVEMGFSPGTSTQVQTGVSGYGGVANDLNGSVYVTDGVAGKVLKITGTTVTALPFTGLRGPLDIAVDGTNAVYVHDNVFGQQRIVKLDSSGKQTVAFDQNQQNTSLPSIMYFGSFAVDGATNLYVAGALQDGKTVVIERFGANGVNSVYATPPSLSSAMAFDTFGTLYSAEAGTLVKYDHFANRVPVASGLEFVVSMAIEPSGTVYYTDNFNLTLMQIPPGGTVRSYQVPGIKLAQFVTIDNYGNLIIVDSVTGLLNFNDRTTQPYAFGNVTVNASSTQHSTLVNVGSTSGLTISSISSNSPFVVDPNTTTCVPGTTNLVAGASCALGFTFTPTAVQSYSGMGYVQIPLPTPSYSATVANLALTGNGVKAAPVANPGGPYTGTAGAPVSFNGSSSTDPNNEALTYAWSFGDNASGTGTTPRHSYASGGTYTVTLTVTNTDGVTASATTTATIAQTYTASLAPSSYSFGNVGVGGSATKVFTLTNTGTGDFAVGTVQLAAEASNSYSATNTCGTGTLTAGQSCTITVTFQPTVSGALATTLTIKDPAGTQTAAITGMGVAPTATLTPAAYDFGSVAVGVAQTAVFTLTNTSTTSIAVGTIVLAPEATNSYSYTKTCGTTLAAGAACTFTVSFKPTVGGSSSTTLNVSDDAGTQKATITGSGLPPTATLTPATYDFGNVALGLSPTAVFTLTNTSTTSIAVGTIVLAPEATNSYSYTKTCGTTLAAGAACTFTLTFKPTVGGSSSTTLNVSDDAGTQKATITGSGSPPTATLTPATYDFGTVAIGQSASKDFTLTNTSGGPIAITTITPPTAMGYARTTNCTSTLAAGASCTITVIFTPFANVAAGDSISVKDDAGTQVASFTGKTVAPTASLTPAAYGFGTVTVGGFSQANFTLTNTGASSFSFGDAELAVDSTRSYSVSSNCPATLAAGASCIILVGFQPTANGAINTTLYVNDGAGQQTSAITGAGASPTLVLTPADYNFGTVPLGTTPSEIYKITNTNSISITLGASLGGDTTHSFSLSSTCGNTLFSGQSCLLTVTFAPTASVASSATLTLTGSAGTHTATLEGTGVSAPQAVLSATSLSFPSTPLNTSASLILTLSNPGGSALSVGSTAVIATSFTQSGSTCTISLAAGASCTYTLTFNPSTLGLQTGTFTVVTAVSGQRVALTGTGVPPLVFDLGVHDFGTVNVGSSAGATFTVTNISAASQNTGPISVVSSSGAAVPAYSTSTNCPTTLTSHASCTITVMFAPLASASYPATLQMVTSSGTLTAALTGTGYLLSSDFTLTSDSGGIAGPSTNFFVQAANPNGTFPYPISFQFDGFGYGQTAVFTPSTVTPGAGKATTVLSFTGHAMLLKPVSPWSRVPLPVAACGLLCLGLLKRRRIRGRLVTLLICLCLLTGALGLNGCGTGSGGTVYATGNGITHQYQLTFLFTS